MNQSEVPIDQIRVEGRHRKNLGSLDELAQSIAEIGLLHPIVLKPDLRLVIGQRRLEACRSLGWSKIPARIVSTFEDARASLAAELDENTCRLDMTPSEKVGLGLRLEEFERPKAEARKAATQAKPGEGTVGGENFSPPTNEKGKTREIVGAAIGMSGPTYTRAKAVVRASQDEDLPPEQRAVARKALAKMDRTGKVFGAYNDMIRQPKPQEAPYRPTTERQHQLAEAQKRRMVTAISSVAGYCRGLEEIDVRMVLAACADGEQGTWIETIQKSERALKAFRHSLRGY